MFEFDKNKSLSNKEKHGIDFEEAQKLWDDASLLEIAATVEPEKRFACFGKIEGKHYTAIITYRNENIRIISVRHSRKEEIKIYENNNN